MTLSDSVSAHLAIFTLVLLLVSCRNQAELGRLALGTDVIVLKSDQDFDSNPGMHVEVQRRGKAVVPTTFVGLFRKGATHQVLGTSGVFGLVETSDPLGVLFLYESTTTDSWPYRGAQEDVKSTRHRGELLLAKLKASLSETKLYLKD